MDDSDIEDMLADSDDNENDPDFTEISASESESDDEPIVDNGTGDNSGWREWNTNDTPFAKKFIFNLNPGFQKPPGKSFEKEIDYFSLFFTDELLEEIVKETNRFAKEKIQMNTPLRKRSIWSEWTDVTLQEMKAFLGLLINMGMNPRPDLQSYFSEDWIDKMPFFKDVFSRSRFLMIFWCLHLAPPGDKAQTAKTRGNKVRNVLDYLDNKYREYYIPNEFLSGDESTVAFKGRVIFKVYNKDKPNKWGIKVYVLCDAITGYILAMVPYFGKTTSENLVRPDLPVTARIIMHLMEQVITKYPAPGYHVYIDRYYHGVQLAEELLKKKCYVTGTIMSNRKNLPQEITAKNLKKMKSGDVKSFRKDDKLSMVAWRDKRVVLMLSTLYDNSTQEVTRKNGETIQKPTMICEYNKKMGGVDLADHYISSYDFIRKTLKWYRKMFFWLFETSIVNSYILFKLNNNPNMIQKDFRRKLCLQLVGDLRNSNGRKRGRPSSSTDEQRLNGLLHIPNCLQGGKTRDCKVCSDRKKPGGRKETKFYCETCEMKPGLHPGECFKKYHTVKKFKAN